MSYSHGHLEPRVLISYARADGEEISKSINELLVSKGIPVWQDKVGAVGMEGGKDWWQQITKAIDKVEFLVLVATKAALQSKNVKKEWLYARQQGVCVYPVKASPHPDYSRLPRWMKSLHFYDLEHEQEKFINDLNTRCEATKVPFMAGDMPEDFVDRPDKVEEAISYLVDRQKDGEPIPCNVVLHGAGGFGKTTLLKAICHNEEIIGAFDDGVLWVTLGQHPTPTDLVFKVLNLIETISGKGPGVTDLETAVPHLRQLLSDKELLIVIDDVWNAENLQPFLEGGSRCSRLISTRNLDIIPKNAKKVHVDAMTKEEATKLLGSGLSKDDSKDDNYYLQLYRLATILGEWPLLLKLVNRAIYHRVTNGGQSLQQAIEYSSKALEKKGLTFFDNRDAASREQAVAKTLSVGIDLLDENERERYTELAVFVEDIDIPLSTLHKLWSKTGGLDEFDTEDLCGRLERLSLIYSFDLNSKTIRLHDVIRKYLLGQHSKENLSRLHSLLLEVYSNKRSWEDLDWTQVDDYGLQYLSRHAYQLRDNEVYKQELYRLLCKPFMQEKFIRYGSYQSFAIDVDLAIRAAQSEEPPNVAELVRGIMVNTTLELTVSNIPTEALWALARVGKEKKALEFAYLMDFYSRINAQRLIADALIERGEEDKAKEILHNILKVIRQGSAIGSYERMELSSKLGFLSERIGMLSETLSITLPSGQGNNWERNQALKLLADYLAQSRLFHQAITIANKIVGNQRMKSFALSNIVQCMNSEGAFEEARALIGQMDQHDTILASIALTEELVSLSKEKEARDMLEQIRNSIELVGDQTFKAVLMSASSIVLLRIGEKDLAREAIIRADSLLEGAISRDEGIVMDIVSRDEEKDMYYRALASVLEFEELLDIARSADEEDKTYLIIIFTAVLAERGNLAQARAVASIENDQPYVLYHAAEVLTNEGHLERALDIAELCLQEKIKDAAAWVLKNLADVMVRRRQRHNSIDIINRMRFITQEVTNGTENLFYLSAVRKDAYTGLAMALAYEGIILEAENMVDNVINIARNERSERDPSIYSVDETMKKFMTTIVKELVNIKSFDQAHSVVTSIRQPTLKPAILMVFVQALVKAGQDSRARVASDELLNFLHETEDPFWGVHEYTASALAWTQDVERANEIINQINSTEHKCRALANNAHVLAELGQFIPASTMADTVLKLAADLSGDIYDSYKRDILITVSKALGILEDTANLNKAVLIANAIDNEYLAKDMTIKEIAIVLAGIGEVNRAGEIIEEGISDEFLKSLALSNIVHYMVEREAFEQARKLTIEKINQEACKALAFGEMSRYLMLKDETGRSKGLEYRNQALALAEISATKAPIGVVNDWDVTALALSELARVFADMQEFDLAIRVSDVLGSYEESLSHTKHRIVAVGSICKQLALSGQSERALSLWIKHLVDMHHQGVLAQYKRDYIIKLITAGLPFLAMIEQGKTLWRIYDAVVEIEGWQV